ncbi:adenine deaminase [Neofamilia massiliensis]|uniref:adenine deaminase n=1 Tax=Neofamilia massiliensis TaxID=1673724 RepID=UPI0006BB5648|nr:adenine deaminase C-terminal domain-containing protein [Neofamilia massiliensis]
MQTIDIKKGIEYRKLIDVLLGDDSADIVLENGKIINVITREVQECSLAIKGKYILMIGDCKELIGSKTKVIDVDGKYISPGFIDSHMHFESSMLTITEFSRLSIVSGTTTLVADPHEIGNALGSVGMKAMADEIDNVPNKVHLVVPALVPDCPGYETSGANISSNDMEDLLDYKNIIGIGELQGVSLSKHVYNNTPEVYNDLLSSTIFARSKGMVVDGNAPDLFGRELAAHILTTGGECSCHETTTKEECVEKLRQGVYVFMREGSTQRNMSECIKAITEEKLDSRRCILATDDMVASDLYELGHMNEIIKRTIAEGVDPIEAIQMATINPSTYFGFENVGVIAPGKNADLAIISDLKSMKVDGVFIDGKLVAYENKLLIDIPKYKYPDILKKSIKRQPLSIEELYIKSEDKNPEVRCIELIQNQNLTGQTTVKINNQLGIVNPSVEKDVLILLNVERYGRTNEIGKCFVTGFEMKKGAIAESIGHDTHNIMVLSTNYEDALVAINRVIENQGGIAIAQNKEIIDDLPLKVGGLITDELTGIELTKKINELQSSVTRDLGCTVHAPFMHLSFLSLSTSPKWKLTNKGLFDVDTYELLDPIVQHNYNY